MNNIKFNLNNKAIKNDKYDKNFYNESYQDEEYYYNDYNSLNAVNNYSKSRRIIKDILSKDSTFNVNKLLNYTYFKVKYDME